MPKPTPAQVTAAQDRAIQQAREWLNEGTVVIDTETTGLDGVVWEFAAVNVHDPAVVLCWVANDGGDEWSDVAREMHAARLDEIAAAPDVQTFADATYEALSKRAKVLAYNADFDRRALERTGLGGIDLLPEFGCVAELYAPFGGRWSERRQQWKFLSLADACRMEHIDLADHHTATADALATAALVQAVAQKLTSAEEESREAEAEREYYDEADEIIAESDGSTFNA